MFARLRRLLLGIALIVAASAVLVLTDKSGPRRTASNDAPAPASKRILLLQLTNIAAFEEGKRGILDHLASVGYSADRGTTIDSLNASGDMATLAQMSTQAVSGARYDLVITMGTAATQSFVRANTRCIPTVTGIIASPPSIGIPLGPFVEGSGRPPCLAGVGTLQPIDTLFRTLAQCDPKARRIGVVWNPAEPNSEVSLHLGRDVCSTLGLELVEANGGNITDVANAADVVLSRGVDAFWILPDVQVISAAPMILERCAKAGVPTITNFPELAAKGGTLNIGADWHALGVTTAIYAELVLRGVDPRTLPIENFVPTSITLNTTRAPARWSFPQALLDQARETHFAGRPPSLRSPPLPLAPESALAALRKPSTAAAGASRLPRIALLTYNRTPNFEECYAGFEEEWSRLGYADGRNCTMQLRDAQFDAGTLNTMASAIAEEMPDLAITFTTPALQATMRRARGDQRIVFSLSSSGVAAGAGTSNTDHAPNITGAQVGADWDRMLDIARAALPGLKRVGTVYSPGEVNSVYFHDQWKAKLASAGIELVSIGADKPTELPEAADALATRGIQAILQIADNASSTGFRVITRAADRANIPVFGFSPTAVQLGATLSVSRDYRDVGRLTARMADRVLRGTSPADIPFSDPQETVVQYNPERLKRFGITLPRPVLDQATASTETGLADRGSQPAKAQP